MSTFFHPFEDPSFHASVITLAPLLFILFALVPAKLANRGGKRFARATSWCAMGAFGLAVLATAFRFTTGPLALDLAGIGPVRISIYFDTLSAVMLLLVSFLGAVITRYACNYLDGDPEQGRFSKWMCATIAAVQTLVISGNLLMFTLAWIATSVSLHQLLVFYPDRPAAVRAAWKKFVISRLGDLCLVGAIILTWRCFGTWDFQRIFASVTSRTVPEGDHAMYLGWLSILLVSGALMKSAQFPFHSWLPDTLETPTPVSALMHAGIINAGGFLVVRLSPIISASPAALNSLALAGAFTALFASVVMLTQTSVKRSLAYSTVAQMGFMMLQCGLGAFALAVLHIVAHSLYKAHAFLSSGSIVSMSKAAWVPRERPAAHLWSLLGTLSAAVLLTWGIGSLFGATAASEPGVLLLGAVFMMALAYFLWNLWGASQNLALIGWGVIIGSMLSAAYFSLHTFFKVLLSSALPVYEPVRSPLEYGVMMLVALLFMAVLFLQAQLPSLSATRFGRTIYVHLSHGFYLGTIANRCIRPLNRRTAVGTCSSSI